MNSFFSQRELSGLAFKSVGNNVLISRYAHFYDTENISIGDNVRIDDFCILSGHIEIGKYIHIAAFSSLYAGIEPIIIMDYSNISSHVSMYAKTDDYSGEFMTNPMVPQEFTNVIEKSVIINKHVIIGTNSAILPGAYLEEGVAIGSCSLVLKNCEAWGIYAGVPVRRIKERKKNIKKLENKFLDSQNL